MNATPPTALSLKQPWATLLVHGLKSIEVRRWSTPRRGRILIHAARVPDARPEAWKHVPDPLRDFAKLGGGIVGAAELFDCIAYPDLPAFLVDKPKHLNEDGWYQPGLFGFAFRGHERLPFRKVSGWFRFFPVEDEAEPANP